MLSRRITIIVGTGISLIVLAATAISGLAGKLRLTTPVADPSPSCGPNVTGCVRFAVIGDFGDQTNDSGQPDANVATMVKSWSPQFIITVGDNNYPCGDSDTIVANLQPYCDYIYNPGAVATDSTSGKQVSAVCSGTAASNKRNLFFPTLGNHEWYAKDAVPYTKFFTKLPVNPTGTKIGKAPNQRYYDFTWQTRDGKATPLHFFAIDSEDKQAIEENCKLTKKTATYEPDGATPGSKQYGWYKGVVQKATEPWKIAFFHHTPYACTGGDKDSTWMQWDFEKLGTNVILAGHKHIYQRFAQKNWHDHPYITNGTGGTELSNCADMGKDFVKQTFITKKYGALLAEATNTTITFYYYTLNSPSDSSNTLTDWVQVTKNSSGGGQTMTCKGC